MSDREAPPGSLVEPEQTIEAHLLRHCPDRRPIYLLVVSLVIGALALLPVIRVDVSVGAVGIIRPEIERHDIVATSPGQVAAVAVTVEDSVASGDVIVTLRSPSIDADLRNIDVRIEAIQADVLDLELLEGGIPESGRAGPLHPRYVQELTRFGIEMSDGRHDVVLRAREAERAGDLAVRGLVPLADLEVAEARAREAASSVGLLEARYRIAWSEELARRRLELAQLIRDREQIRERSDALRIRSPVGGTIAGLSALSAGSYVGVGDLIATISPDADLIAELFVAGRDIGFVHQSMQVRLAIDAFDPNDWGVLTGDVETVPNDFTVVDGAPVFRVVVRPDSISLRLPSGIRGELKKGMGVRGRMVVARRSLFQLLRDDLSDWLQPSRRPLPS